MTEWATASMWLAVLGSGLYHGVNPGMGWPLAVSAALMHGGRWHLVSALGSLAWGHFLAMAVVLLPFAMLGALADWQREIRIAAGLLVVGIGVYQLAQSRHPRFLARIRPRRLALWSFAAATAHGAGLMLVPLYLGLCQSAEKSALSAAVGTSAAENSMTALAVAASHAGVMILAGGTMAFAVHEWLGPRFIGRSWFNLETVWSLSLVLVGGFGIASAAQA